MWWKSQRSWHRIERESHHNELFNLKFKGIYRKKRLCQLQLFIFQKTGFMFNLVQSTVYVSRLKRASSFISMKKTRWWLNLLVKTDDKSMRWQDDD